MKSKAVVALLALALVGCGNASKSEREMYRESCHNKGGVMTIKDPGGWMATWGCIPLSGDGPDLLPEFRG